MAKIVTRACAAHASMQLDSMIITVPHEYGSSPPCPTPPSFILERESADLSPRHKPIKK